METNIEFYKIYQKWDRIDDPRRLIVDGAFHAAYIFIERNGKPVSNDDRAERLIAALTRYVIESESESESN